MARIDARVFESKQGARFVVRTATPYDASSWLKLAKDVLHEELFHITTAEEFTFTIEEQVRRIEAFNDRELSLNIVAELQGLIVGLLYFENGQRQRLAHLGEFGMSVARDLRGLGIGSALVATLLEWARGTGKIEKIELLVNSVNPKAQALYERFGFEVEGVKKKHLKYAPGHYADTILMGRFVLSE